jgi:hypothetical protein
LPPANTTLPSILGTAQEGEALTATVGGWTNGPTSFAYQWQWCDGSGKNCSAILGATVQSYKLTAGDVGQTIRVQEIASNAGGDSAPAVSAQTAVVKLAVPVNTGLPSVTGTAQEGQTLTALAGAWTSSGPISFAYQWQSCSGGVCSPIVGAASKDSYTLASSDVGQTIRVLVTASNAGGAGSPATSTATPIVTSRPTPVVPPGPPATQPPLTSGKDSSGPTPVSAATIRAMLSKAMSVQGPAAKLPAVLKQGGYSFSVTAPSAGHLVMSWYTQSKGKKVLVAKVTFTFTKAGAKKVKIALRASGRQLVRTAGRMTITVNAAFTPSHQRTTSMTKKLTLRW